RHYPLIRIVIAPVGRIAETVRSRRAGTIAHPIHEHSWLSLLARLQYERGFGVLLHDRLAERIREILLCRPQFREIVEVRAARLSRLAGRARANRTIPVGKVDDLAERRASRLAHVTATGREDRIAVAGPWERSDIESKPRGVPGRGQRVLKRGGVELAPG